MFHNQIQTLNQNYRLVGRSSTDDIENRIYIRREFTRKKGNLQEKSVKRPFCCTVSILQVYLFIHIFMLYNLLGPGTSFYRKSKINIKRKPNYEIGWFIIDQ